jgi:hypothetical protein
VGDKKVNSDLLKYLVFIIIFIGITVLTFVTIYNVFGDETILLNLNLFSSKTLFKLVAILILYFLLDSFRLFYILKTLDVNVSFRYIVKLALVNIFISNITPFATGGGFAQIYFLNRQGVSIGDATAASTIRTVLPIFFFTLFTPIVVIFDKRILSIFPKDNLIIIGVLILVYSLGIVVFYNMIRKPKMIKIVVFKLIHLLAAKKLIKTSTTKKWIQKIFREIDTFSKNITRFFLGNKKNALISLVITILFLLSLFLFPVILIKSLNTEVSSLSIIASQIVITFAMYFAPTPGATGVAEGGFTLMFAEFIEKADVVSLLLAWRFFTIYIGMLIGMVIFYFEMFRDRVRKEKGFNL